MFEKEIKNFKWIISDKFRIVQIDLYPIEKEDREFIFNGMEVGMESEEPVIMIDCSFQRFITKLRNSTLFTLTEILVSKKYKDEELGRIILAVQGTMPIDGISIRTKKPNSAKMSEERKYYLSLSPKEKINYSQKLKLKS